jgi:hypothetical protein
MATIPQDLPSQSLVMAVIQQQQAMAQHQAFNQLFYSALDTLNQQRFKELQQTSQSGQLVNPYLLSLQNSLPPLESDTVPSVQPSDQVIQILKVLQSNSQSSVIANK